MTKRHDELTKLLEKARRAEKAGVPGDLAPPDLGARNLVRHMPEDDDVTTLTFDRVRAPGMTKAARDGRAEWAPAVPRFSTWTSRAPSHQVEEDPEPEPPAPLSFPDPVLFGKSVPVHPLAVVTQMFLDLYLADDAPWREDADETPEDMALPIAA